MSVVGLIGVKLRAATFGAGTAVKNLSRMVFRKSPVRMFGVTRSAFDYLSAVGDGTGSSTVMAPLLWIARTFPEAPLALWQDDNGIEVRVANDHPMLRLMRRPNPHYTRPMLWMATLTDYYIDGNAYWLKIRDRSGRVVELWWAPQWTMEPKGTEDEFITHYEYKPSFTAIPIAVDDVVHFRYGLDSDDPRKGRSPLKSVLREVFTDDEAANFTASLLRNMGVPGLLVSPDGDHSVSPEDAAATKAYIKENFSGDGRGSALVMSGPTKVQQFGFSPEQLLLKELRRVPEERVSAVLGVPAIVAGLGAGLDRSTFSNMAEARQMGYESTIIPAQETLAEDLWHQLLPDFEPMESVWLWRVGFDLSRVRVLQPDMDKLAARLDVGVRGGWVQRGEARRAMGHPVAADGSDNVYLIQMAVAEVPANGDPPRSFTPLGSTAPGAPVPNRTALTIGNGAVAEADHAFVAAALAAHSPDTSEAQQ